MRKKWQNTPNFPTQDPHDLPHQGLTTTPASRLGPTVTRNTQPKTRVLRVTAAPRRENGGGCESLMRERWGVQSGKGWVVRWDRGPSPQPCRPPVLAKTAGHVTRSQQHHNSDIFCCCIYTTPNDASSNALVGQQT